jgi:hypothetical protein
MLVNKTIDFNFTFSSVTNVNNLKKKKKTTKGSISFRYSCSKFT